MNRPEQALHTIEPPAMDPHYWDTISHEKGILKKYLFRWYIEEDRGIGELANEMRIKVDALRGMFKRHEILEKGKYIADERPSRLRLYFEKAELTATRTTCLKGGTGAVLINTRKRDVLYSFNGPPSGDIHCTDVGTCKKDVYGYGPGEGYETCVAVHAEQNIICEAAAAGISTEGKYILVTRKPCPICWRLIRMARLSMMIFPDPESNELIGFFTTINKILNEEELEKMF